MNIYSSIKDFKARENRDNKEDIRAVVLSIIQEVKNKGDQALISYTERFDKVLLNELRVPEKEIEEALSDENDVLACSLKEAIKRIKDYHQKQKRESWFATEQDGTLLGQKITPIDRVGIYVPGGTAAYPSSVLMNAIPALVAGVKEIAMVTPPNQLGKAHPHILAAAKLLGIKEIYTVGGAQAIAALAYGTETIKAVDKIVGPGNIFVATAKKEVFGTVGIDMVAGPSEIVVVGDETANPIYIAADLLSQAEHDPMAQAVFITPSYQLAKQVQEELINQLKQLPRKEIAEKSLNDYGGIIVSEDIRNAIEIVNELAPEHLELMVAEPFQYLAMVKHAGAIFLGSYSPEPVGDYMAGPNHVLPTNGTARFSSPLNVDDFIKKSSIIAYSKQALLKDGSNIITLAEAEGLYAHGHAIRVRMEVNQ